MVLPASTRLGAVTLAVRDHPLLSRFYREVIGVDDPAVLRLLPSDLPFAAPGSAGLYHTAFLFESRADLAHALERVAQLAPSLYQGSADHLVSEAFYLADPEGNGIELYADRPRDQWKWENGRIVMASEPLDPGTFIQAHGSSAETGAIGIGHVHLKVGDIAAAQAFYADLLGFDITAQLPSALFVAAGGYHHHLGMNTWESEGAGRRHPSLGLHEYEVIVPPGTIAELESEGERDGSDLLLRDPWGTTLRLVAA